MKSSTVIAAAMLLASCATPTTGPEVVASGPSLTQEQATVAIRRYLGATLKDPDSLKQFEVDSTGQYISWYRGLLNGGGHESAWLWCFQYNAKNSYGAYTGVQRDGIALRLFKGDAIVVQYNAIINSGRCF